VLFAEPTTMVDPLMVDWLGDLIARLKVQFKLTSLVITHDIGFDNGEYRSFVLTAPEGNR
jgi:ABC-type transporter Mla maintaining outer membrane lipid asymmetry ATPase subunit MlaF